MGLSPQWKGPGRVSLPVQTLSRKPLPLSKLTLAPAIRSYSVTAFFTASMSRWWDIKTVILSMTVEKPCYKRVNKRDATQGRIFPFISKPLEQGLQSKDIKRRQGLTLPNWLLNRKYPQTPFIYLHHWLRVVVHHANPSAELRFESGSLSKADAKNWWSTLSKPLDWSELINTVLVPSFNSSRVSQIKYRLSWINHPCTV